MSNKYFSGRRGHYIFCDICGQAVYDNDVIKLSSDTGRPNLLVCPKDADQADFGLIPYTVGTEKSVRWARVNHANIDNAATPLDYDTTTELGT